VLLLAGAIALFTHIGAEFVPQLDEGDVLIEARRLPGISLDESVATALRLEHALLGVPEVQQAVNKIGAPEIATDPMGVEQSDVFIELKDRSAWRAGLTKAQLAQEIAHAAEESVPEIVGGVSQPIQMRTNELVAGVRSDVAVLVYGQDLDQLRAYGDRVAGAVRRIPGAVDVRVEQVAGLKYLRVIPDRGKMARYGFTIEDVNQLTETMSVGYRAGDVLEGERRFGITDKTRHGYAGDLEQLRMLPLRSLSGQVVPLGDVADFQFVEGPAQVSRESQSRRLTVEFNVRGRDMLSVVREAQAAVAKHVALPTGHRAEWGGQFEHYTEARSRLSVVVPLAFTRILFFLWLAFRSMRSGLLIFLDIPFAIVGGVVALWLRDIPFSISAGIGFIALFGVAVLNGLVLVSFARHLEEEGVEHADAIRQAAERRLRPVLTTALVAALGFLPMALSTAPGSEVQKPLATVVIGGLVTATLLTMFVLPVAYTLFGKGRSRELEPKVVEPS
jgi:cobalt-zinc-cadmium resistance protein CzcA